MTNDEEHIRRAERARQLIESDIWGEAWAEFKKHWIDQIIAARLDDPIALLEAKRALDGAERIRSFFERLMVNGKVSAETVRFEKERSRRISEH